MALLHVAFDFPAGGIEAIIRNVCRLNPESGTRHDIALVNGQHDIFCDDDHYTIYACRLKKNGILSCFFRMKKIISSYDAVYLHSPHPIPAIACVLAGKSAFSFQHGLTLTSKNLFRKFAKYIWYYIFIFLIVKYVVCSTEYAYQKMKKRGLQVPRCRIVLVSFGVQKPSQFTWKDSLQSPGELQVGTAGRFVDQKRFDRLLESLRNYVGTTRIVFNIAGDGPDEEHLRFLAEQIRSSHVDINFCGWVNCLDHFYHSLDIFVFSGRDESLGLVVLESLVRGVPVVVLRDVGGALEFIRDGTNGVILDNEEQFKSLWMRCGDHNFVAGLRRGAYSLRDHAPTCEKMRKDLEKICQLDEI